MRERCEVANAMPAGPAHCAAVKPMAPWEGNTRGSRRTYSARIARPFKRSSPDRHMMAGAVEDACVAGEPGCNNWLPHFGGSGHTRNTAGAAWPEDRGSIGCGSDDGDVPGGGGNCSTSSFFLHGPWPDWCPMADRYLERLQQRKSNSPIALAPHQVLRGCAPIPSRDVTSCMAGLAAVEPNVAEALQRSSSSSAAQVSSPLDSRGAMASASAVDEHQQRSARGTAYAVGGCSSPWLGSSAGGLCGCPPPTTRAGAARELRHMAATCDDAVKHIDKLEEVTQQLLEDLGLNTGCLLGNCSASKAGDIARCVSDDWTSGGVLSCGTAESAGTSWPSCVAPLNLWPEEESCPRDSASQRLSAELSGNSGTPGRSSGGARLRRRLAPAGPARSSERRVCGASLHNAEVAANSVVPSELLALGRSLQPRQTLSEQFGVVDDSAKVSPVRSLASDGFLVAQPLKVLASEDRHGWGGSSRRRSGIINPTEESLGSPVLVASPHVVSTSQVTAGGMEDPWLSSPSEHHDSPPIRNAASTKSSTPALAQHLSLPRPPLSSHPHGKEWDKLEEWMANYSAPPVSGTNSMSYPSGVVVDFSDLAAVLAPVAAANAAQRASVIKAIESGDLMRLALQNFQLLAGSLGHSLSWSGGGVQEFLVVVSRQCGLSPAHEEQVFPLFMKFVEGAWSGEAAGSLDVYGCLCLTDALFRSIYFAEFPSELVAEHIPQACNLSNSSPRRENVYARAAEPMVRPTEQHPTSLAEQWVESYNALPTAGTVSITYSSGVVVSFGEFAEALMPLAVANSQHRARVIQTIESGELMRIALSAYKAFDRDGHLPWDSGELRDYVTLIFQRLDLNPPSEVQVHLMYAKFDVKRNGFLDASESLCLVDALFRSIFHLEAAVECEAMLEVSKTLLALVVCEERAALQAEVAALVHGQAGLPVHWEERVPIDAEIRALCVSLEQLPIVTIDQAEMEAQARAHREEAAELEAKAARLQEEAERTGAARCEIQERVHVAYEEELAMHRCERDALRALRDGARSIFERLQGLVLDRYNYEGGLPVTGPLQADAGDDGVGSRSGKEVAARTTAEFEAERTVACHCGFGNADKIVGLSYRNVVDELPVEDLNHSEDRARHQCEVEKLRIVSDEAQLALGRTKWEFQEEAAALWEAAERERMDLQTKMSDLQAAHRYLQSKAAQEREVLEVRSMELGATSEGMQARQQALQSEDAQARISLREDQEALEARIAEVHAAEAAARHAHCVDRTALEAEINALRAASDQVRIAMSEDTEAFGAALSELRIAGERAELAHREDRMVLEAEVAEARNKGQLMQASLREEASQLESELEALKMRGGGSFRIENCTTGSVAEICCRLQGESVGSCGPAMSTMASEVLIPSPHMADSIPAVTNGCVNTEIEHWVACYVSPPLAGTPRIAYSDGVVVDFSDFASLLAPVAEANAPHRELAVATIESADLMRCAWRTFQSCDKGFAGTLEWSSGEIQGLIAAVFRLCGLIPPTEGQMRGVYAKFLSAGCDGRLAARECLQLVDALFRAVFSIEVSGASGPASSVGPNAACCTAGVLESSTSCSSLPSRLSSEDCSLYLVSEWDPTGRCSGRTWHRPAALSVRAAEEWVATYAAQVPALAGASDITYPCGTVVCYADLHDLLAGSRPSTAAHCLWMVQALESGELARQALQVYRACDVSLDDGSLEWESVHGFVAGAFERCGLSPPTPDETFQVYAKFDAGQRGRLDARECLCLADALIRLTLYCPEEAEAATPTSVSTTPFEEAGEKAITDSGSPASSIERWIAGHSAPPAEGTPSLAYAGDISVNFSDFAKVLAPIAVANASRRGALVRAIDNGEFLRAAWRIFQSLNADQFRGSLAFEADQGLPSVVDLVTAVFRERGLSPPSEEQMRPLYAKFRGCGVGKRLVARDCLHFLDALGRSILYAEEAEEEGGAVEEAEAEEAAEEQAAFPRPPGAPAAASSPPALEEWVASYNPPPVSGTESITYLGRVPVKFGQFAALLAPAAAANAAHRGRVTRLIEDGGLLRAALRTFRALEGNRGRSPSWCGYLAWDGGARTGGEIAEFVASVFRENELSPPEDFMIQPVYAMFDSERNMRLDGRDCLCLVDAVVRAVFYKDPWARHPLDVDWVSSYVAPPLDGTASISYLGSAFVHFAHFAAVLAPGAAASNAAHRDRMVQAVESGSLLRSALQVFLAHDRGRSGFLGWNEGEVRAFVAEVLRENGLCPPSESQIYQMYVAFDTERSMRLDASECLCLVDALVRAIFYVEGPSPYDCPMRHPIAEAEEWVSSYVAPDVAKNKEVTYLGRTSVRFADYSASLATIAAKNASHRERMVRALEDGSVVREALQSYHAHDKRRSGFLTWGNGEIQEFVATVFQRSGLEAVPMEAEVYPLYAAFDTEKSARLDVSECLCLTDALLRAVALGAGGSPLAGCEEDALLKAVALGAGGSPPAAGEEALKTMMLEEEEEEESTPSVSYHMSPMATTRPSCSRLTTRQTSQSRSSASRSSTPPGSPRQVSFALRQCEPSPISHTASAVWSAASPLLQPGPCARDWTREAERLPTEVTLEASVAAAAAGLPPSPVPIVTAVSVATATSEAGRIQRLEF